MKKVFFQDNLNSELKAMILNEIKFVENLTQLKSKIKLDYSPNDNLNIHYILKSYLTLMFKIVSPIKSREVLYSEELKTKLENKEIHEEYVVLLSEIKDKFERGEDINMYLSGNSFDPEKSDGLLYDWGIHHLHLSDQKDPNKPYFFIRSDYQLIFYLEFGTVNFMPLLVEAFLVMDLVLGQCLALIVY